MSLARIHCMSCGSALLPTPRLREPVHDKWPARARARHLREDTGGRVIFSVVKVGGVVRDVDDAMFAYIKQVLEGLKDEYRQIMNTLLTDTSVKNRLVGVGYVSHDDAVAESMVGPFGRASGVNYDARTSANGWYGGAFPSSSPSCPTTAIAMRVCQVRRLRCCSPSTSSKRSSPECPPAISK